MIIPEPRSGIDKREAPFTSLWCTAEHELELAGLYDRFSPRGISQGLPPVDGAECRKWVSKMLTRGWNFLIRSDKEAVGHAAVIPDLDRADGEYIIFVLQPFRNRGLGSVLTEMAVKTSRNRGLTTLWLTVESYNFRAIRVYWKVGFEFCDQGERERTMMLRL
jgi:diamine N-acetyltransferase